MKTPVLLAGSLLIAAALAATPAEAGGRHKHRHRAVHKQRHAQTAPLPPRYTPRRFERHSPFRVPLTITRGSWRVWRPYYDGRAWFEPHRHTHGVYYFPVRARGRLVWTPHFYCEGRLLRSEITYHGPRFGFYARY